SPGTCILHDAGYSQKFPELGFTPAAAVLTRCISRPGPKLVTFDIGTKAICADPPLGQRVHLVGLEQAVCTLHNEEHYVVETEEAELWKPGMTAYAIPKHICPTVAMYDTACVVENGKVTREIPIAARGRS
ncbi:MAG TPA: D-TA family PLP-dependent enzyme, partial [Gemmatales bacterium]|nr:D-TA family PLP-dependent enzyme [Gemmatales bacterium]